MTSVVSTFRSHRLPKAPENVDRDHSSNATHERQESVNDLAKQVEVLYVVGGRTSSNSNKLVEVAVTETMVSAEVVGEVPMVVNEVMMMKIAIMEIVMAEIAVAENMAAGTVPIRVSAEVTAAKMAAIHVTTSEVSASDVTTAPMSTAVPAACANRPPPKNGPRRKTAQNTTARAALFRAPANLLTDSIFMSIREGTSNRPVRRLLF